MTLEKRVYLALGDSMTIDHYPEEDAASRFGRRLDRIGAASLLYENCYDAWPEFDRMDLVTRSPWLGFENRATDGAIIETVLQSQLPATLRSDVWLATLTMGGNDLLELLWEGHGDREAGVLQLQERYSALVVEMTQRLPEARLILSTIYDPTDGTGTLPGRPDALPVHLLQQMNDHIRTIANTTTRAFLADVHAHFAGHGLSVSQDDMWYLPGNPIEPGARGASEIRRVWWDIVSSFEDYGPQLS